MNSVIELVPEEFRAGLRPLRTNTKGTNGATAELIAATELMQGGWEVFRSLSPNSKSDLVIRNHCACLGVQVKTANLTAEGKIRVPIVGDGYEIIACVVWMTDHWETFFARLDKDPPKVFDPLRPWPWVSGCECYFLWFCSDTAQKAYDEAVRWGVIEADRSV